MSGYTIIIPKDYTAGEWICSHELAHFLNEEGYGASVTTLGTGVGKTLFFGNSEGLSGNLYSLRDMHVSAGSAYGFEKATEILKSLIEQGELSEETQFSGDAAQDFAEPTVYTLKRSGDARVMYCNVFNALYKVDKINTPELTSGPIPLRHMMEKELFGAYLPDVLCLQEYSKWFRDGWEGSPSMTSYLEELGYVEAVVESPDGIPTCTPVFYLPDRLELVESGFHIYSGDYDDRSKSVTWARLRIKVSGKQFVAMSTHFMWNAPHKLTREQAIEIRKSNAREALALIDEIAKDSPVIFGGDLNCNTREEAWLSLAEGGLTYAKNIAGHFNTSRGWKSYAIYDSNLNVHVKVPIPPDGNGIDHVFVKGNIKVDTFMTVTDKFALLSTDHCPKFADIVL